MHSQVPSTASLTLPLHPSYQDSTFDIHRTSDVLKLKFKLKDSFGNTLSSSQVAQLGSYSGSTLVEGTYSLTMISKWDESKLSKTGSLGIIDSDGFINL